MRIIFFDCNVHFINPTRNLIPNLLLHIGETFFFGPGYNDPDTLKRGPEAFMKRHGPFDMAVATEHILFHHLWPEGFVLDNFSKSLAIRFPVDQILYGKSITEAFNSFDKIRLVSLMESDFYNFPSSQIELLDASGAYFITACGLELLKPVNECSNLDKESFSAHANDNFHTFLAGNAHRFISFPHFLDENEFSWSPLAYHPAKWSVPGSRYYARTMAQKVLEDAGIHVEQSLFLRLQGPLAKLGINLINKPLGITILNQMFRGVIEKSCYSFTCGSALNYLIRKFFEIPAVGTLLVHNPHQGLEHFGFRHNETAISCAPEDLLELHHYLENNHEIAQSIAEQGRLMVWKHHTISARARQLTQALDAIQSDSFQGAGWKDGRFSIVGKGSSASDMVPTI